MTGCMDIVEDQDGTAQAETKLNAQQQLSRLLQQAPGPHLDQNVLAKHIASCSLEQLKDLGLTAPPVPVLPKHMSKLQPAERLQTVQRVISSLQYNHQPGYLFNATKGDRPYNSIMNTAKEILREALPIKARTDGWLDIIINIEFWRGRCTQGHVGCIEATFLGMLLTSDWSELERLPVGFKSTCAGQTHKHIVLAVHHVPSGKWGALGISRRPQLQYKDLEAGSLAELMMDYKQWYEYWGHALDKIRVGLPTEHDPEYTGGICWRYCHVSCSRHPWEHCKQVLDMFEDNYRTLANRFKVLGFKPPSRGTGPITGGGTRIACSGTTPEPGATRPTPVTHHHGTHHGTRASSPKKMSPARATTDANRQTAKCNTRSRNAATSSPSKPAAQLQHEGVQIHVSAGDESTGTDDDYDDE